MSIYQILADIAQTVARFIDHFEMGPASNGGTPLDSRPVAETGRQPRDFDRTFLLQRVDYKDVTFRVIRTSGDHGTTKAPGVVVLDGANWVEAHSSSDDPKILTSVIFIKP